MPCWGHAGWVGLLVLGLAAWVPQGLAAAAYRPPEPDRSRGTVFLTDTIERPLRYTPDGTDFVITNGAEFFNRPLYGSSTPFRVDGGDKPEFSLYLPGHGGNLRLGFKTSTGVKWLHAAEQVVSRYRPGSLLYEVRDPWLGEGVLRLAALALVETEGLIIRVELGGTNVATELVWAFGGVDGKRGQRDGDIGCEREPVSRFFQLKASQCAGNVVKAAGRSFQVQGKPGTIGGVVSAEARLFVGSASNWADAASLAGAPAPAATEPVLVGRAQLRAGQAFHLALCRVGSGQGVDETLAVYREAAGGPGSRERRPGRQGSIAGARLARIFEMEEQRRRALAERVVVETPDPFINAAAGALNVAADAIWDERQTAYLHGAVAWRVRLLGWRAAYAGDALGWHERTAAHFAGYAKQQNTNPVPARLPGGDESANLARSEAALHSNGDLTKSHYDMNLVGVDAFFRHLLWTGDLDYARRLWPTIERHLAWERRLFRREFGPEKLPLYEAYCCIWASDDVAYNGGGATHSSAYNLYHNRMAARVARLIGKDPQPYAQEAELIARAMQQELWLSDRGWFGESKDLLGLQSVHPNAAAWTFYHTLDCQVPSPMAAWQMTRAVDTQLARIPLRGPGVPAGSYTLPTTAWMPYSWSVNNVVMAEVAHTALAYWQAGRPEGAFPLLKGAVLDSMYLGLCPGNVGMCTYFDAYRHESQRDFGDGVGALSRALVEGLFGVQPDALAGELAIRPGFPAKWAQAGMRHPDFDFAFRREGLKETFTLGQKFSRPLTLRLRLPALRDGIASVTVNGRAATWKPSEEAVGVPRIEIQGVAASRQEVVVLWQGRPIQTLSKAVPEKAVARGELLETQFGADELSSVEDPQGALSDLAVSGRGFRAKATGTAGHRTVFARVRQGVLRWREPVSFEIGAEPAVGASVDWRRPVSASTKLDMLELASQFNDRVTQIFRQEYRSPRSPFCSLALPKQGIGSWCHPKDEFEVDDSGLRAAALKGGGKIVLPNGVPLATPGAASAKNVAFVSQWDNYPRQLDVPLTGRARQAFLLMAGSTGPMQSRFDNGEVIVTYTDGTSARLALHNPTTWWPIEQDYYIDDFAFARPEPLPVRVDLQTGRVRVLEMASFKGQGRVVPGGAATVLALPLEPARELKSLTVRALANEVVIGLMSVTLQR